VNHDITFETEFQHSCEHFHMIICEHFHIIITLFTLAVLFQKRSTSKPNKQQYIIAINRLQPFSIFTKVVHS